MNKNNKIVSGLVVLSLFVVAVSACSNIFGSGGSVAEPVISPPGGQVTMGTKVTITCATEGAEIRYTIDGTEPGRAVTGIL